MVFIKNGTKYYTIEESKKITKDFIEKSANDLILELRKKRAQKTNIDSKKEVYV